MKLKDLGHPLYLDQKFEDKLECSAPMSVAEKKVYLNCSTCFYISPCYMYLYACM